MVSFDPMHILTGVVATTDPGWIGNVVDDEETEQNIVLHPQVLAQHHPHQLHSQPQHNPQQVQQQQQQVQQQQHVQQQAQQQLAAHLHMQQQIQAAANAAAQVAAQAAQASSRTK